MEGAFFWFNEEIETFKHFEDMVAILDMFIESPLCMDYTVVHIKVEVSLPDFFFKFIIYHCLEGAGGIRQPKEHDGWFEETITGFEGGLPLVAFFDTDVVVAPTDIKFCIPFLP